MNYTKSSQVILDTPNDISRHRFEWNSSTAFSEKHRSKTLLFNSTYTKPAKKKIIAGVQSIYKNN